MVVSPRKGRTDTASRIVEAQPATVYRAFVDPKALAAWLPPQGMKAQVEAFDPRPGGAFRITLTWLGVHDGIPGKTTRDADTVQGRFGALAPGERVVWITEFVSDDPAFAGEMTMTWSFSPVAGGTLVSVSCEGVPEAIAREDHDAGLRSSLENLAAFVA